MENQNAYSLIGQPQYPMQSQDSGNENDYYDPAYPGTTMSGLPPQPHFPATNSQNSQFLPVEQDSQDPYSDIGLRLSSSNLNYADNGDMELELTAFGSEDLNNLSMPLFGSQSQGIGLQDSIGSDLEREFLSNVAGNFNKASLNHAGGDVGQPVVPIYDINTQNDFLIANENISFENHLGEYCFQVSPSRATNSNKCVIDPDDNKFYCDTSTYDFQMKVDFHKVAYPEKMTVRVAIVFTEAEHQDKPTKKCINCTETAKKLYGNDLNQCHIVRGVLYDPFTRYITSPVSDRDYLIVPMKSPELGADYITQKLTFTCRSSCKSGSDRGINRRPTALIFTLFDERFTLCGRSVFNIRICSAPQRDFKNDKKEKENSKPKAKKRKLNEKMDGESPAKVAPPPLPPVTIKFEESAVKPQSQDKDSSSQESTIEFEERPGFTSLKLRQLLKDSRRILSWRSSSCQARRVASHRVFDCLKLASGLCEQYEYLLKKDSQELNAMFEKDASGQS